MLERKITVSIIIPTQNRAAYLKDTLSSLAMYYSGQPVEVLIIDNGSTDNTRQTVQGIIDTLPFSCFYHFAPCPGLHVGRNLGIELARGDVLAYLDDDVLVAPSWLDSVIRNFSEQPHLALLGGPCLPKWEGLVPSWVDSFRSSCGDSGWVLGALSLVHYSETHCEVPGDYIFGCNYCIRKDVAIAAGGFHPDGVPSPLLKYRGDGETGMGRWVANHSLMICYDPQLMIEHRVPESRLTYTHFLGIYKRNGISDGYALARSSSCGKRAVLTECLKRMRKIAIDVCSFAKCLALQRSALPSIFSAYYNLICIRHLVAILLSKQLSHWVLQDKYFSGDPCPYWRGDCKSRSGIDIPG